MQVPGDAWRHQGDLAMSDNNPSAVDPLGQIADEFVEAFRQGRRPSVEEFARRYPDHADAIREMLPALVLMEKAKSGDDSSGQGRQRKASAAARPLQQLGDYQILREVGRGGMGQARHGLGQGRGRADGRGPGRRPAAQGQANKIEPT
jgi:hypothetical protein